jgi:uncharacterized protein YxjI
LDVERFDFITIDGQLFAVIKQKIWPLFRNHFIVDVNAPNQHAPLILACTVVVDLATEKQRHRD